MHRVALRFAGLLIIVVALLKAPDYVSTFLATPGRSFLLFATIAFLPLAIPVAAGFILWRFAERLAPVLEGTRAEPALQLDPDGSRRLLAVGAGVVAVYLLIEGASELVFWIGRYMQMRKAMPHVEAGLGEDFMSIVSTVAKLLIACGVLLYARGRLTRE
jgi:hypothetical protein